MTLLIHLVWEGPISLESAYQLRNEKTDYGVYQVYGRHPVVGVTSLLYIGKAEEQPFGARLKQEKWEEVSKPLKVSFARSVRRNAMVCR